MRKIATLFLLFSCCTLAAQPLTVTENREQPRSAIVPYATADEAAKAPAQHRYGTQIEAWTQEGSSFKATFTVPFAWNNRQVVMRIAHASADYEVWINGRRAAANADGNSSADFNLTRLVKEGRNEVEIRLADPSSMAVIESWKEQLKPALGAVQLVSPPTMGVRELLVQTHRHDTTYRAEIGVVVKSYALNPRTVRIYYDLLTPAGELLSTGHNDLTLRMRGEDTVRFLAQVPDTLLWSRERPQQCVIRLRTQRDGRYMEYHHYPVGLRSVEVADGTLMINGDAVTLRSAEVAPTATAEELQSLVAAGTNLVRLKTGAVAPHLLTTCDELGLYVVVQAPIDSRKGGEKRTKGGNPSNDPAWTASYVERVENSYHTTKRHPSVVGFSIARESANGIGLYESYLRLKQFDDSRPILYPEAAGEWNSDAIR